MSERDVKAIKWLLKKSECQYKTILAYMPTPNDYSPVDILMG